MPLARLRRPRVWNGVCIRAYLAGGDRDDHDAADAGGVAAGFDFGDAARVFDVTLVLERRSLASPVYSETLYLK